MDELDKGYLFTGIGVLEVVADQQGVVSVLFADTPDPAAQCASRTVQQCLAELDQYFSGRCAAFTVPLHLVGTPFQQEVWHALLTIPFGHTASYGEIAHLLGRPSAARAVGGAVHRNPISIIVPCHRIIGSDGSLTGYAGGLHRKEWLLAHERRVLLTGGAGLRSEA